MNKKELISQSLTVILVIFAVIITALVIRRELSNHSNDRRERKVENWQELDFLTLPVSKESPFDSPVQIIKFYDYQCPYCKRVQPSVEALLEKYQDRISIFYAHLPLQSHKYAFETAMAAECARNLGSFKNYNSILFERQDQIDSLSYINLAREAGVQDLNLFSKCVENKETKSVVEKGIKLAEQINVSSIPTFMINGQIFSGALTEEYLIKIVEDELENQK